MFVSVSAVGRGQGGYWRRRTQFPQSSETKWRHDEGTGSKWSCVTNWKCVANNPRIISRTVCRERALHSTLVSFQVHRYNLIWCRMFDSSISHALYLYCVWKGKFTDQINSYPEKKLWTKNCWYGLFNASKSK